MVHTHHDPMNNDARLEELEKTYRAQAEKRGFQLSLAREGMELDL